MHPCRRIHRHSLEFPLESRYAALMGAILKIGVILAILAAGAFGIAMAIGIIGMDVALELLLRTTAAIAILTIVSVAVNSVAGNNRGTSNAK
jgi:hypothetical protein